MGDGVGVVGEHGGLTGRRPIGVSVALDQVAKHQDMQSDIDRRIPFLTRDVQRRSGDFEHIDQTGNAALQLKQGENVSGFEQHGGEQRYRQRRDGPADRIHQPAAEPVDLGVARGRG